MVVSRGFEAAKVWPQPAVPASALRGRPVAVLGGVNEERAFLKTGRAAHDVLCLGAQPSFHCERKDTPIVPSGTEENCLIRRIVTSIYPRYDSPNQTVLFGP